MSNVYWISFRLMDNPTYANRFNNLHEAIEAMSDGMWWLETTSFYILRTRHNLDEVISIIKSTIDEKVDLALVGSPYIKTLNVIGNAQDDDIFELVDFAKKL